MPLSLVGATPMGAELNVAARTCGSCAECCDVSPVEALDKPGFSTCAHLVDGVHRCGIHGQDHQPDICKTFRCAWLQGAVPRDARPDATGLLMTAMMEHGSAFGFIIETRANALWDHAAAVVAFARTIPAPVIISDFGSRPPEDTGDRVVVRADLVERTRRMQGKCLGYLDTDVLVYALVKEKAS